MIDDKRHARIKSALSLKHISLSDIARSLAVTPSTVSIVSRGYRRSRRVEQAIADALGQRPEEIWPDRYRSRAVKRREEAAMPAP
ncbi:helix-turn-helix domain-containing protein [Brevundimonas aurantiaca]|uniref:helix-turn-helix domain-containing protein n=1 Tax=Brevundimonas aurantiaca TaxID=74316 RepID=UPI003A5C036D